MQDAGCKGFGKARPLEWKKLAALKKSREIRDKLDHRWQIPHSMGHGITQLAVKMSTQASRAAQGCRDRKRSRGLGYHL